MAILDLGQSYRNGDFGLAKDSSKAVELIERAARLGLKEAHFDLARSFDEDSYCLIEKDMARAVEHYEIAAKQGHVGARHNLGCIS